MPRHRAPEPNIPIAARLNAAKIAQLDTLARASNRTRAAVIAALVSYALGHNLVISEDGRCEPRLRASN